MTDDQQPESWEEMIEMDRHAEVMESIREHRMATPKGFCEQVEHDLGGLSGEDYGSHWCNMRMLFHRKFSGGLIFSTRLGADFFRETIEFLNQKDTFLKPSAGEDLGEYDANYNRCLKQWRKL